MTDDRGAGLVDRGIHIADGIERRPRGYWTDTVHDLLRWLDETGFDISPRLTGLDDAFEYLQFVTGQDQGWPLLPFIQTPGGARLCGVFARRLESTLATYRPADDARWQLAGTVESRGPVAHGDLGPWNLLWDAERGDICGLIDWDLAGPAPKGYDAGQLAWQMVPMMDDDHAYKRGFTLPANRADRLRAFSDGYGAPCGEVLDLVIAAQEELERRLLSASDDEPPIYAMLKKLGIAAPIREDMQFAQTWKETL